MIDYLEDIWNKLYFEYNTRENIKRINLIKLCDAIIIYFLTCPCDKKQFKANIKVFFKKYLCDFSEENFDCFFDLILKMYQDFYKVNIKYKINSKNYIKLK